jgi:hypothetical protein
MNDDEELPRSSVALTGYSRPRHPAWGICAARLSGAADLA